MSLETRKISMFSSSIILLKTSLLGLLLRLKEKPYKNETTINYFKNMTYQKENLHFPGTFFTSVVFLNFCIVVF